VHDISKRNHSCWDLGSLNLCPQHWKDHKEPRLLANAPKLLGDSPGAELTGGSCRFLGHWTLVLGGVFPSNHSGWLSAAPKPPCAAEQSSHHAYSPIFSFLLSQGCQDQLPRREDAELHVSKQSLGQKFITDSSLNGKRCPLVRQRPLLHRQRGAQRKDKL